MNLARRVARLERTVGATPSPRLVLRFEGPGSEDMKQPSDDQLDQFTEIHTVVFIS